MDKFIANADDVLPDEGYLKLAENFFKQLKKNILKIKFTIVILKKLYLLKTMHF